MAKKRKSYVRWCKVGFLPINYGYCPDKEAWDRFCKWAKIKDKPFPEVGGGLCCPLWTKSGALYLLVLVSPKAPKWDPPYDVAGIIVHEAVHVWQFAMQHIAEQTPSWEFEAGTIQHMVSELNKAYRRAHKGAKK